jgi:hypothetical protein
MLLKTHVIVYVAAGGERFLFFVLIQIIFRIKAEYF